MPAPPRERIKAHFAYPLPVTRRLLWHVLCVARGSRYEPITFDPVSKPGATLLWLESGRTQLQLDSNLFQLRPGPSVWLYSLQQRRFYRPPDGKPYIVCSIRFGGPNLGAWLDELDATTRPEFRLPHPGFIHRAHGQLMGLVTTQPTGWEYKADTILSLVMSRLLDTRKSRLSSQKKLPPPIIKVLDTIAADPDRAWTAREFALLGSVSYSHLRHLFRESMHISIHSFLQQKRLDRARTLLAEGELSIKEIAEKLHFGNEFYFSSFFKTKTGLNPSQFRKQAGLT